MLTKSQLKEVFARYEFTPLKRLGENYLIDGNIKNKIIAEANVSKNDTVLEVGPGLGALTIDLARTGARIFAVEKDRKAFEILTDLADQGFPNLKLFNEDILKFDAGRIGVAKKMEPARAKARGTKGGILKRPQPIRALQGLWFRPRSIKVIGNLPYYITTPVIEWLIDNRSFVDYAVIMIQREVASRLMAGPGSKDYSALSCFVRYHTRPSYIYTVKRSCFYPAPEVDSAIIRLDVLARPSVDVKDEAVFFKIVRGAFNQRRKSIINSLSREAVLGMPKEKLLENLGRADISPRARPETLSLSDFAKIANSIINSEGQTPFLKSFKKGV